MWSSSWSAAWSIKYELCVFLQGFSGKLCETRDCESGTSCNDDPCQSRPCRNGASCMCDESGCRCDCPPLFYGDVCQFHHFQDPSTHSPSSPSQSCSISNCRDKAGDGQCDVCGLCLPFNSDISNDISIIIILYSLFNNSVFGTIGSLTERWVYSWNIFLVSNSGVTLSIHYGNYGLTRHPQICWRDFACISHSISGFACHWMKLECSLYFASRCIPVHRYPHYSDVLYLFIC